jgi:hypothetical protein
MIWIRGTIMSFDALTIAGLFAAMFSGWFLLAVATMQAPREPTHHETRDGDRPQRSREARLFARSGGHTPHHRGFV